MNSKYKTYQTADFLHDSYFIESHSNPTEVSREYWELLLDKEMIDSRAYQEAKSILLDFNLANNLEVDDQKLKLLWERIESTNRKREQRKHRIFLYAAAASIGVLLFIGMKSLLFTAKPTFDEVLANNQVEELKRTQEVQLILADDYVVATKSEESIDYSDQKHIRVEDKVVGSQVDEITYNQVVVPYGQRSSVVLSDSTILHINAGTHVVYPSRFSGKTREIYVNGEVYAEVTKNKKRPFIIQTDDVRVKVLGTKVNVNSYAKEHNPSVVLVSGSVAVDKKGEKTVTLKPNQEYAIRNERVSVKSVDALASVSWTQGVISYEERPLSKILSDLSKYYGVQIQCEPEAALLTCYGSLDLKEKIEQMLDGLCLSVPITYNYNVEREIYQIKLTK